MFSLQKQFLSYFTHVSDLEKNTEYSHKNWSIKN